MTLIAILSLGGTIAMMPSDRGGVAPALSSGQVVAAAPGLDRFGEIEARSVFSKPGAHLTFDDLVELAELIQAERRSAATGIIVTQGTDTIEETAFALDLLLQQGAPVVVTGAMRHPSSAGPDGPANLLAAAAVVTAEAAKNIGVVVVMNDVIHAARFVRKGHTSSTAAFISTNVGPLGWVREGIAYIGLSPGQLPNLHIGHRAVQVGVIQLGLGDEGSLIAAAIAAGLDGLVVSAPGAGHVSTGAAAAIEKAAAKLPVVLASRTGAGATFSSTYGFPGSEIDLLAKGAIPAGHLDAAKARVLLTLLLRADADQTSIRSAFERYR